MRLVRSDNHRARKAGSATSGSRDPDISRNARGPFRPARRVTALETLRPDRLMP